MSDATDAINDIQDALDEYGSSITLNVVTIGGYDPVEGEGLEIITPHNIKSLIKDYTTKDLENQAIHVNDIKFRFYYNSEISYDDQIVFGGKTYSLENIDKKIFQDENLIYTIQGRV